MIKLLILHDVDKQLIVVFDWLSLIVRLSLFSGFPHTYLKDSWIQLKLNKVKYTSTRESYIPASIVAEEISICMEETLSR
jgi:hypothetical protein